MATPMGPAADVPSPEPVDVASVRKAVADVRRSVVDDALAKSHAALARAERSSGTERCRKLNAKATRFAAAAFADPDALPGEEKP